MGRRYVGNTILQFSILVRCKIYCFTFFFRFLLYDCDKFTRNYFKEMLCIVQPDPIELFETKDNHSTVDKKVMKPNNNYISYSSLKVYYLKALKVYIRIYLYKNKICTQYLCL